MSELKPGAVTMAEIRAAYPGLAHAYENSRAADPETAEWIDGPGLLAWIREQGFDNKQLESISPSFARRSRTWHFGSVCHYATADRWLVPLGLHLRDIPANLWRTEEPRGKPNVAHTPEAKAAAVARVDDGEPKAVVARSMGVSEKAVREWCRIAAEKKAA